MQTHDSLTIEVNYLELNSAYFRPLVDMVQSAEPFLIAPSNIEDPYNLGRYLRATTIEDVSLKVLIDNNVLVTAVNVAKGELISKSIADRQACAVMAFLLLGDFLIEPSMAIYEKASTIGHEWALKDFYYFRLADHIHPNVYAEIALGIIDQAPKDEIEEATNLIAQHYIDVKEKNFAKSLDVWKLNYLSVLKAAILFKQNSGSDAFKLRGFK